MGWLSLGSGAARLSGVKGLIVLGGLDDSLQVFGAFGPGEWMTGLVVAGEEWNGLTRDAHELGVAERFIGYTFEVGESRDRFANAAFECPSPYTAALSTS
jgi:hypothetical protein